RKHIRKSLREGIVVETVPFTDELVNGICEIYNETPLRQGRPFWHFRKPFATVKAENGTYLDRSILISARCGGEMVGYLKLVVDEDVASIMQIVSKVAHAERRPTNALISKAVETCEATGARYLVYGKYVYGTKTESSLIDFKQNNGFAR